MSQRQKLVAGNWKMHGSPVMAAELVSSLVEFYQQNSQLGELSVAGMVICPPSVFLADVHQRIKESGLSLGAQTLSEYDAGAYTGELSGNMLKAVGCDYVLVGHSERRTLFGETNVQVAEKFMAAQQYGLTPILCVGETLSEREQGQTEAVVFRQLDAVANAAGIDALENAVIAYEPVWAIGTGKTATPEQAQGVHKEIRTFLADKSQEIAEAIMILYGGSVKPDNAAELFGMADIDGGLIGGASLKAEDFLAIWQAAN